MRHHLTPVRPDIAILVERSTVAFMKTAQDYFSAALITFRRKNNAPRRGGFSSHAVHFLHDRT